MANPELISLIKYVLCKDDIVLDIGCGNKQYCVSFQNYCKKYINLDAWDKANPNILLNISKNPLPFKNKSLDIILMIDVIEHMSKKEGVQLLIEAERVCRRAIIILTPLWWDDNMINIKDPNSWYFENRFNIHKSLWTREEFAEWQEWTLTDRSNYFVGIKYL